jgi:Na+-transporting NADH:ubiquinone oxidoreductase subunit C
MQHSNKYIFIYSLIMVLIVAVALTIVAVALKPAQEENIRNEKMKDILSSINIPVDGLSKKAVSETYARYIVDAKAIDLKGAVVETDPGKTFVIEMGLELKKGADQRQLPLFIGILDSGDSAYIIPVRGKGLWGPIWGYISFRTDFNTIFGTTFDHKGETPGLGAEINQPFFEGMFIGKKIFDDTGKLVSIRVIKGGAKPDDTHGVDAISGGTITSNGVDLMISDCLTLYEAYFKKHLKI